MGYDRLRVPGYHVSVRNGATGRPSRLYSAGAVGLLVQRYRTATGFATRSLQTTTRFPSSFAFAHTNRRSSPAMANPGITPSLARDTRPPPRFPSSIGDASALHRVATIRRTRRDHAFAVRDRTRHERQPRSDILLVARMKLLGLAEVDGDDLSGIRAARAPRPATRAPWPSHCWRAAANRPVP